LNKGEITKYETHPYPERRTGEQKLDLNNGVEARVLLEKEYSPLKGPTEAGSDIGRCQTERKKA